LPALNYTLSDIFGALIAFGLFPLVIVFPGYVTGWLFDLFDFRQRRRVTQFIIGLCLSFAISPIVLYLTARLVSIEFASLTAVIFAVIGTAILVRTKAAPVEASVRRPLTIAAWIGALWVVIAILSLVDIQWHNQLYFSIPSFDQTTRVSVIEAMTRTGVPPVNPSYYPGKPVLLTFLYFFWYILCSVVDWLGGSWVDARAALNASSAWAGLGMMATIALYLRLRDERVGEKLWRAALIGIGSLSISGLDCIPIIFMMILVHVLPGDIEHWNTQITAWAGSFLWVPHHIAGMVACLTAIMVTQTARGKSTAQQLGAAIVAGLAFASALGLSVWVTLIFVIFWGVWMLLILIQTRAWRTPLWMTLTGLVAVMFALPFLLDIFSGGSGGGSGSLPFAFEVRIFYFSATLTSAWPPIYRSLLNLAVLPINYFFELGFFLLVGMFWFKLRKDSGRRSPFHTIEIILLAISFLIGSFVRSTLIFNNDLGWRAWLPGQFVLLIWGVDVLEHWIFSPPQEVPKTSEASRIKMLLVTLAVLGIVTTGMDLLFLRLARTIYFEPGAADQSFAARQAYDFLREQVPPEVITQNNPLSEIDRPSGLYGTHQMVISDRTAYGVPANVFQDLANRVGSIFTNQDQANWQGIDGLCRQYSIDILIFQDTDPVWISLPTLEILRPPIYKNQNFALFTCGDYSQQQ
jgi:hypothetical protein